MKYALLVLTAGIVFVGLSRFSYSQESSLDQKNTSAPGTQEVFDNCLDRRFGSETDYISAWATSGASISDPSLVLVGNENLRKVWARYHGYQAESLCASGESYEAYTSALEELRKGYTSCWYGRWPGNREYLDETRGIMTLNLLLGDRDDFTTIDPSACP